MEIGPYTNTPDTTKAIRERCVTATVLNHAGETARCGTDYLGYAQREAELVGHLACDIGRFPEAICCHSQQVAEGLARNALVANGIIPNRFHDVQDLLVRLIDDCRFEATSDDVVAAAFLSSCAAKYGYAVMAEAEKAEAVGAICSTNHLADAFGRNGYPIVRIDCLAKVPPNELGTMGSDCGRVLNGFRSKLLALLAVGCDDAVAGRVMPASEAISRLREGVSDD